MVYTKMLWTIENAPVPYTQAIDIMEFKAKSIREKKAEEEIWLLEHPSLYTAGTSARPQDLINPRFPVFETGRGGQYTYHGPGQRVVYAMMDLQKQDADLRKYIFRLEDWIIKTLSCFDVVGERRDGRVGIWIDMSRYGRPEGTEAKIAAIGVRVKKWVAYHGLAINVNPDLSHYDGIIPCGISQFGVTSLNDLGVAANMKDVDKALQDSFDTVFTLT